MLKAPWTDEQVAALNRYQAGRWMHPFTCGGHNCRSNLLATNAGWICPNCNNYKQDWAHEFMTDPPPPWHKPQEPDPCTSK